MLNPFWPVCPRLHHGVMISDPCGSGAHHREWVCRTCGTRLYGTDQGGAAPAAISNEQPKNANTGNHTGRARNVPSHYGSSKERERNYIQANPRES
jgi:hypothetical protein